ncbi:hypothetical protein JKP88DRAFT_248930 [Tribonema minus]|uniref:DUF4455 domain-containing protein n=1 Tax=Tribonema minus TaxID=303371 RepID=A0A836C970_9STRA|nr:hypothetical protein JKP88DRAFT_248930 [Tribonema minus]
MSSLARAEDGLIASLRKGRKALGKDFRLAGNAGSGKAPKLLAGMAVEDAEQAPEKAMAWTATEHTPTKHTRGSHKAAHSSSSSKSPLRTATLHPNQLESTELDADEVRRLYREPRPPVRLALVDDAVAGSPQARLEALARGRRDRDAAVVARFELQLTDVSERLEDRVLQVSRDFKAGLQVVDERIACVEDELKQASSTASSSLSNCRTRICKCVFRHVCYVRVMYLPSLTCIPLTTCMQDGHLQQQPHEYLVEAWGRLDSLCQTRSGHVEGLAADLEAIEVHSRYCCLWRIQLCFHDDNQLRLFPVHTLESQVVGGHLQVMVDELLDIGARGQGEIERAAEVHAAELNEVLIANRRVHIDLLVGLRKAQVATAARVRQGWEAREVAWRLLRHQRAVKEFTDILDAPDYKDPPARRELLSNFKLQQQDFHAKRCTLIGELQCLLQKQDKTKGIAGALATASIKQISAQLQLLLAEEASAIHTIRERLQECSDETDTLVTQRREALRAELHSYGALQLPPDLQPHCHTVEALLHVSASALTGVVRCEWRQNGYSKLGFEAYNMLRPELEVYFSSAGGLRHELKVLVTELKDPDMIYHRVAAAAEARCRELAAAASLDPAQVARGSSRGGLLRSVNETLARLAKVGRKEVARLLPQLRALVLELSQVSAISDNLRQVLESCAQDIERAEESVQIIETDDELFELDGVKSKLGSASQMKSSSRHSSTKSPPPSIVPSASMTSHGNGHLSMSRSPSQTSRGSDTASRALSKTTSKRSSMSKPTGAWNDGIIINTTMASGCASECIDLPPDTKAALAALHEGLQLQLVCIAKVDEEVSLVADELVMQSSSAQAECLEHAVAAAQWAMKCAHTAAMKACCLAHTAAKACEQHATAETKHDEAFVDTLYDLAEDFRLESEGRESDIESATLSVRQAAGTAELEDAFSHALELLGQAEEAYRRYHSRAHTAAAQYPTNAATECWRFQQSLLRALGMDANNADCTLKPDGSDAAADGQQTQEEAPRAQPPLQEQSLEPALLQGDSQVDTVADDPLEAGLELPEGGLSCQDVTAVILQPPEEVDDPVVDELEDEELEEIEAMASEEERSAYFRRQDRAFVHLSEEQAAALADTLPPPQPVPKAKGKAAAAAAAAAAAEAAKAPVLPPKEAYARALADYQQRSADRHAAVRARREEARRVPLHTDGQPFVLTAEATAIPEDQLAQLVTSMRNALVPTAIAAGTERVSSAKQQCSEKQASPRLALGRERAFDGTEGYMAELEERLRTHWPRRGRLEVGARQPREGELSAHRAKALRFSRQLQERVEVCEAAFTTAIGLAQKQVQAFTAKLAQLQSSLPSLESEAALQGAEARAKRAATDFAASAAAAIIKLQHTSEEEQARLLKLCDDSLRSCRVFAQGGDYSEQEIDLVSQQLQASRAAVMEMRARCIAAAQGVQEQQAHALEGVEAFQQARAASLKELSLREGLGKIYGAPRRAAQEHLRAAVALDERCCGVIDGLLDSLQGMVEEGAASALNVYCTEDNCASPSVCAIYKSVRSSAKCRFLNAPMCSPLLVPHCSSAPGGDSANGSSSGTTSIDRRGSSATGSLTDDTLPLSARVRRCLMSLRVGIYRRGRYLSCLPAAELIDFSRPPGADPDDACPPPACTVSAALATTAAPPPHKKASVVGASAAKPGAAAKANPKASIGKSAAAAAAAAAGAGAAVDTVVDLTGLEPGLQLMPVSATFGAALDQLKERCIAETKALYSSEGRPELLTGDDGVTESLARWLRECAETHARHQAASTGRLRQQAVRLEGLIAKQPPLQVRITRDESASSARCYICRVEPPST